MQLGWRIPENLSIVGIGDFAGSADMFPALSTVQIPAVQIGIQAGKYLVGSIGNSDAVEIVRRKMEVALKPRATTGHAAGG